MTNSRWISFGGAIPVFLHDLMVHGVSVLLGTTWPECLDIALVVDIPKSRLFEVFYLLTLICRPAHMEVVRRGGEIVDPKLRHELGVVVVHNARGK